MFTGIIESLGRIESVEALEAGSRLWVATELPVGEFTMGESIAIAGACMTVVGTNGVPGEISPAPGETSGTPGTSGTFAVDVSAESLRKTTLGSLSPGDAVNLERSMRANALVGGHFVSGHVDGVGSVRSIEPEGESALYTFETPPEIATLLVEKGSVAVDGISLTCFNCTEDSFTVAVIPHTSEVTTLGLRKPGDAVNLENDVLGKYVQKLVAASVQRAG